MTTRTPPLWRPALLALLLLALLVGPSPAIAGTPAARTPADGAAQPAASRYLSSAEARHTLTRRVVLTQDTATTRRATLVSHVWRVDVGGGRAYEFVVYLGRKSKRPMLYRSSDFHRVPCRAASRERFSGGSGSTIVLPGACLRSGGSLPRVVTVQAQTTVLVSRPGLTTCRTESSRRLGPFARGEGGGVATGRRLPLTSKGC